ncbi:MAG: efflux RND transporter periplasmic adaptor subunit [Rhodobacteraceae bacterium]|nr:efflux RND transporter periplasmic adaptor subunit [Paracoccaceae bacterium]
MKRSVWLPYWAVGVGLFIAAGVPAHAQNRGEGRAHAVTAATVTLKPMPVTLNALGRIEPVSAVAVRPRIDGVVSSVDVAEGQIVTAGQVLLHLDDRQATAMVRQARGTLQRDQAQLDQAKRDLDRLAPLSAKDFASRATLDKATAAVESLTGTVLADQGALDNAETVLSFTTITAPIAGRIGSINAKLGNAVRAADPTPLLSINQMDPIHAVFAVPQADALALREAMAAGTTSVRVSANAQGQDRSAGSSAGSIALRGGEPIDGAIAFIENEIDAETNMLGIKASLANPSERLWPGEFVDVTVTLRVEPGAIVVPEEAVQLSQTGSYVFVIQPDDTVRFRPVEIAWSNKGEAVIRTGLAAGDQVVLSGQMPLQDGSKVRIQSGSPGQSETGPSSLPSGPAL